MVLVKVPASGGICGSAERLALAIGSGAHQGIAELPNPKNGATDIGTALGSLRFDVNILIDGDRAAMEGAPDAGPAEFGAGVVVGFSPGHLMETDATDRFAPVDARLERETDAKFEAGDLNQVVRATERRATGDGPQVPSEAKQPPSRRMNGHTPSIGSTI
ncbi:MAG: hypothetical protein OXH69_01620 [Acidobacteria bacterium]|nr:hypothetical protein [Acidobacteriota bacterium]